MTNYAALYETCNSIASTFYPSHGVVMLALANVEIDPEANYATEDVGIIKAALELVQGFVATLQIDGDIHNNTYWEAVRANIIRISNKYGLDPGEYITLTSIQDASFNW